MFTIEGIPVLYLKLAVGQRLGKGAIGVFNQVSPYLGNADINSAVVSFSVVMYCSTVIVCFLSNSSMCSK